MEQNNTNTPHYRPSISKQSDIVVGLRSHSLPVTPENPHTSAPTRPSDSLLEMGKKAAKLIKNNHKKAKVKASNTNVPSLSIKSVPTMSAEEIRSRRTTLATESPKKIIYRVTKRSKSLSSGFKNSWDYSLNFVQPEEAVEDETLKNLLESLDMIEIDKKDFQKIKNTITARAEAEDSPRGTNDLKKEVGTIVAASKERLVKLITSPLNHVDDEFLHRFLLTYRLWFTPEELLRMICQRVLDVIKIWIERNPNDFTAPSARTQLEIFTSEAIQSVNNLTSDTNKKSLLQLIDILMNSVAKLGDSAVIRRWSARAKKSGYMRPMQPMKKETLNSVLEITPTEFARQLTIIWKKFLDRILPADFILTKNTKQGRSALMALTDEFNTLTNWVTHEIVTTPNLKKRVKLIEHFLLITKKLLELNNFLGAMGVHLGTQMMASQRLKQTWKKVNKRHKETIASYNGLFSPVANFAMFRKAIHGRFKYRHIAAIPFLPILQKDIVAVSEVTKDLTEDGLINLRKIAAVGNTLSFFWECQQTPYKIIEVRQIQEFIAKMGPIVEDRKLIHYSKQCEPPVLEHLKDKRGKEKKKETKQRKRAKAAEDPIKAIFGSLLNS